MTRAAHSAFVESVIARFREEMNRRHLTQLDTAGLLGWTQSRVAQKLNRKSSITLEEFEALCFAIGLSKVEVVRDPGLEFVAELTPSEVRLLQRLRQLPAPLWDALMVIVKHLHEQARQVSPAVERYATPPRSPFGRARDEVLK